MYIKCCYQCGARYCTYARPSEQSSPAYTVTGGGWGEMNSREMNSRVPTHPSEDLKVFEFFYAKFKALKVLENRTGAWKSLNFIPQVLESPWIHRVKLCDISNFVEQHLYRTGKHYTLLTNLPGILPNMGFVNNCHVLFLSTKTVTVIKEIDIKYCCNMVHAVNFVENCSLKMQLYGPWNSLKSPWILLPKCSGNPGIETERLRQYFWRLFAFTNHCLLSDIAVELGLERYRYRYRANTCNIGIEPILKKYHCRFQVSKELAARLLLIDFALH